MSSKFTKEREIEIRKEAAERLRHLREERQRLLNEISTEFPYQKPGKILEQIEELKWPINYAPSTPTPTEYVDTIINLANIRETDIFYEPGCGKGGILCNVVKKTGCEGIGVEIEAYQLNKALELAQQLGVEQRVKLIHDDYYNPSVQNEVSRATVVYFFLDHGASAALKPQFGLLLEKGARIVSRFFRISGWESQAFRDNPYDGLKGRFYLYAGKSSQC